MILKKLIRRIPDRSIVMGGSFKVNQKINSNSILLRIDHNYTSISRFFSDRRYSEKHEWVLLDSKDKTCGTVGISDYAQAALGDVVYVQLPDVGSEVEKDCEIGAIESVKAANEIYSPVSGKIIDINKALEEKPGLVNTSCYDEGWLFKINIKDDAEVNSLMDEKAYEEFLKTVTD